MLYLWFYPTFVKVFGSLRSLLRLVFTNLIDILFLEFLDYGKE